MSRVLKVAVVLVFVLCACVPAANALPGDLDPSFGTGGVASFADPSATLQTDGAIGVQSDGKIVLAVNVTDPSGKSLIVKRFNTDGSPDGSFGILGQTRFDFDFSTINPDSVRSLKVLPDDKILIVGSVNQGGNVVAGLARLQSNGLLDPGFVGGFLTLPQAGFGGNDAYQDSLGRNLVLSSSGSILQVSRLQSNGVVDSTFNAGNWFQQYDPNSLATAAGVMLAPQSDGKTLVGAFAKSSFTEYALTAMRLDGSVPDTSYSGDGLAQGPDGFFARAGVVQADDKIVLAGRTAAAGPKVVVLNRFDTSGQLDPTFGTGGVATHEQPGQNDVTAITADAAGRLITLERVLTAPPAPTSMVRYLPNGQLDPSFGNGGVKILPIADTGSQQPFMVTSDAQGNYFGAVSELTSSPATFVFKLLGNAPVPPKATFDVKISSPKGKTAKAKKLKGFSGTASSNYPLAKVEIALQRVDKSLLRKKKRCLWLKSSKGALKKVRAKSKKCSSPVWLKAVGTAKWSYKLKKPLKAGSYVLSVRATTTDGAVSDSTKRTLKLK